MSKKKISLILVSVLLFSMIYCKEIAKMNARLVGARIEVISYLVSFSGHISGAGYTNLPLLE